MEIIPFSQVDVPSVELIATKKTVVMTPNGVKTRQSLVKWWEVNNPGWETIVLEANTDHPTQVIVHPVGYIPENVCLTIQVELEKAGFASIIR